MYRVLMASTVEDGILRLQGQKRALVDAALSKEGRVTRDDSSPSIICVVSKCVQSESNTQTLHNHQNHRRICSARKLASQNHRAY